MAGPNPKVVIRMQQIARLRIAGIKDGKIAEVLGITQSGLSRIIALAEYRDIENAALNGYLSKVDEELAGNTTAILQTQRMMVPAAQRALLDAVLQRKDTKASIVAATEILDRDPDRTLVKASRSESRDAAGPTALPAGLLANLRADSAAVARELAGGAANAAKPGAAAGPVILTAPNKDDN